MTEKYELNEEDKAIIKGFSQSTTAALLRAKEGWNFNVGDVLVRYRKYQDGRRVPDTISSTNPAPKKYKVVHIDEVGVPYVKIITSQGDRLSRQLHCLANQDFNYYEFGVDPDLAESILMDNKDGYDPMLQSKLNRDKRKSIIEYNKKLLKKCQTIEEMNAIFAALNKGDSIWICYFDGRGSMSFGHLDVDQVIKYKNLQDATRNEGTYYIANYMQTLPPHIPVYVLKTKGYHSKISSLYLLDYHFTTEKPRDIRDEVSAV